MDYMTNFGKTFGVHCGAENCVYNKKMRCVLERIELGLTGQCMRLKSVPRSKYLVEWRKKRHLKKIEKLQAKEILYHEELRELWATIVRELREFEELEKLDE